MKNLNRANTTINNPVGKYPLIYLVKIKRGVAWSVRRIELDRERIKYFKNEKDNELRFNEKTDDCNLLEKNSENDKKYYLLLVSKSGNFKEVKISCEQVETLRQLKKDFDFIQNYKSTISDIQNKTFIIESDKTFSRSLTKVEADETDNQTVHKSILGDEASTITRSVITRTGRPTFFQSSNNHMSLLNEDLEMKKQKEPENFESENFENTKPNENILQYPKLELEEKQDIQDKHYNQDKLNLSNNNISQNNLQNEKESVLFTDEIVFKKKDISKIEDSKNTESIIDSNQISKTKNQNPISNIASE